MSELSPRASFLVQAGRSVNANDEDRARVRAALRARLAVVTALPFAVSWLPKGFLKGLLIGSAAPLGAAVLLGGAWVVVRGEGRPPAKPVAAAVRTAAAPPAVEPPPALAEAVARSVPVAAPVASPRVLRKVAAAPRPQPAEPESPSRAGTLTEEVELLRVAQRALVDGDGASALSAVEEHRARFPDGALREERDAAQVFALCALKRLDEARLAGGLFVASYPSSPLASRVLACGSGR